jgi:hypothetical protein
VQTPSPPPSPTNNHAPARNPPPRSRFSPSINPWDSPDAGALPTPNWTIGSSLSSGSEASLPDPSPFAGLPRRSAKAARACTKALPAQGAELAHPRPVRARNWWAVDIARLEAAATEVCAAGAGAWTGGAACDDKAAAFMPMGLQPLHEICIAHRLYGRRCWFSTEMGFFGERGERWAV